VLDPGLLACGFLVLLRLVLLSLAGRTRTALFGRESGLAAKEASFSSLEKTWQEKRARKERRARESFVILFFFFGSRCRIGRGIYVDVCAGRFLYIKCMHPRVGERAAYEAFDGPLV